MRVVELFAGVGGFRRGLEEASKSFETVWFNQWEPATNTVQHAHSAYVQNFGKVAEGLPDSNSDIFKVEPEEIPDHDLLVGGFPCQDYSVATTLDKSKGLHGPKGQLWWAIERILRVKKPTYALLENVDRLIRSPARQRGKDFAVILASLHEAGYDAEWRCLRASDYGFGTKRRRVFIFAVRRDAKTAAHKQLKSQNWFTKGFFGPKFEAEIRPKGLMETKSVPAMKDAEDFEFFFGDTGRMAGGAIESMLTDPVKEPGKVLGDFLEANPASAVWVSKDKLPAWEAIKDAKAEQRKAKNGHEYHYKEGRMTYPDAHHLPARTILTGEAGQTPNRSTHVVLDPKTGKHRFLTPEECERIMGFPPGHTEGIPPRWRYFTMGNALVVGLVTRMGERLLELE